MFLWALVTGLALISGVLLWARRVSWAWAMTPMAVALGLALAGTFTATIDDAPATVVAGPPAK